MSTTVRDAPVLSHVATLHLTSRTSPLLAGLFGWLLEGVGLIGVLSIAACARPAREVPLEAACPRDRAPLPPRNDAPAGSPGTLEGRAFGWPGNAAPRGRADLEAPNGRRWPTIVYDSTFAFRGLTPGNYRLRLSSIGYQARIDTIVLTTNAGRRLSVVLRPADFDGCPYLR